MGLPLLERISDYLPYYGQKTPQADALVFKTERISYLTLKNKVEACAKALIAAGVKSGDRVATLSPPHPDYFIVFLAAASIGAIWMGLNPKYQLDESRYVISDAQPVLLFARTAIEGRDYRSDLQILQGEFDCLQTIVVLNNDPAIDSGDCPSCDYQAFIGKSETVTDDELASRRDSVKSSDPALLVYTSGTTGKPKGALLPHRGLVKCSLVQRQYINVAPLSAINFFPINHVGCVSDINCFLFAAGGCCHFMEKFDAEGSLKLIEDEKVSLWIGGPTTFQISFNLPNFDRFNLSSIKMIVWGGGAASIPLIEKLQSITPKLCNAYGQTETVGSVTFTREGDSPEVLQNTVGKPPECYDVQIVNPQGDVLGVGEEGEIVVRGDFTMCGYLNRPEATAETIDQQGYLHTGDLGVWREDGNIQLVGRIKEMFKSGGYNVYPLEVEQVLQSHPAIDDAVVVAVPHELYSEVGYGYLQVKAEVQDTVNLDDIKQYCREKLANYKVPKHFEIITALPLLPIGKVDRKKLKQSARKTIAHQD